MHVSNVVKPLFWFAALFAIVLAACSGNTADPIQSTSTAAQEQAEAANPVPGEETPEASETSAPPADPPVSEPPSGQPVFGYIDASPAVFIQPESGLRIEIFDGVYDPETGGLEGYRAKVTYPAGDSIDLEFRDIAFNISTGSVDGYAVSVDGDDLQGPTIEEFESKKSGLGPVVAFSLNPGAWMEPLPVVSVPCQGDSTVQYDQAEGRRQVARHTITCGSQTYTLQYSAYAYDDQLGTLTGYSVLVEITP